MIIRVHFATGHISISRKLKCIGILRNCPAVNEVIGKFLHDSPKNIGLYLFRIHVCLRVLDL